LNSTLLVIVVVAVVALVVIGLIAAFVRSRGPRLRPLPEESRNRFAGSWRNIEARFIEDPRGAVQEADRTAVMILGERGATIHDDRKVPDDLQKARAAASSAEGRQGTEGMRQAMVLYKHIVDDAVGTERMRPKHEEPKPEEPKHEKEDEGRREVAS
jgi:hypothetical protein